ncbi:MAG: hypothetical protein GWP19_04670 [Planctomycetia bacterium]|nr:hypothetical protein [Planctomycetia bacterium]
MLNFHQILSMFHSHDVSHVYYKILSENDNSKNQPYLGGSYDVLRILPLGEISEFPGIANPNFKCKINLSWLTEDGQLSPAPHSKLILYTKYPEVRLSGFLMGCADAPSRLMNPRRGTIPNRIMYFGVTYQRTIIAYIREVNEEIIRATKNIELENYGALTELEFDNNLATVTQLVEEIRAIQQRSWCRARYLRIENDEIVTIMINNMTNNCHGMTLEAELGVVHNANAKPDWKGWEFKAKKVPSESSSNYSLPVTLMTPEPDGGLYNVDFKIFMENYGRDNPTRKDFTGIHYYNKKCEATQLILKINGFNNHLIEPGGGISLFDPGGTIVSSWSFSKLMKLWNNKHQKFVIVPCIAELVEEIPHIKYLGPIGVGRDTDFIKFLDSFINRLVKLDPACHLSSSEEKRRHQWRITSKYLNTLYNSFELIHV